MADLKISQLTAISVLTPATDVLPVVDVGGVTKKITTNQILGSGGTATLASATITGDLTVDTSTLKVDSTNNRVGINTATPAAGSTLHIVDADPTVLLQGNSSSGTRYNRLRFQNSASSLQQEMYGGYFGTGGLYIADYTNNGIFFGVSNTSGTFTERYAISSTGVATWSNVGGVAGTAMTLNSTGLGIGRGPLTSLDVFGSNKTNANEHGTLTVSSSDAFAIDKGGSIAFWGKYNTASGNACFARVYGAKENATDGNFVGYFAVATGGGGSPVERFRIDSSGNVGIGVTPGAWRTSVPFKALQIGYTGAVYALGATEQVNLSSNYLQDTGGNEVRIQAGYATRYQQSSGQHLWSTAASSTAGSGITFTQAMTLDGSGNLGVGITNPSFRIHTLVSSGADRDIFAAQVLAASNGFQVKWNHATTTLRVILANIPTSAAGLASGTLWNDAGTIKIA